MMRSTLRLALRHETSTLQQLCAVFLQKPLDRSRTAFMRSDVNVAEALNHMSSRRKAIHATFTNDLRKASLRRFAVVEQRGAGSFQMISTTIDTIAKFRYSETANAAAH
jgi:hypothetical protein